MKAFYSLWQSKDNINFSEDRHKNTIVCVVYKMIFFFSVWNKNAGLVDVEFVWHSTKEKIKPFSESKRHAIQLNYDWNKLNTGKSWSMIQTKNIFF